MLGAVFIQIYGIPAGILKELLWKILIKEFCRNAETNPRKKFLSDGICESIPQEISTTFPRSIPAGISKEIPVDNPEDY